MSFYLLSKGMHQKIMLNYWASSEMSMWINYRASFFFSNVPGTCLFSNTCLELSLWLNSVALQWWNMFLNKNKKYDIMCDFGRALNHLMFRWFKCDLLPLSRGHACLEAHWLNDFMVLLFCFNILFCFT